MENATFVVDEKLYKVHHINYKRMRFPSVSHSVTRTVTLYSNVPFCALLEFFCGLSTTITNKRKKFVFRFRFLKNIEPLLCCYSAAAAILLRGCKTLFKFYEEKRRKQQQQQQRTISVKTRKLIKWKLNFGWRGVCVCVLHTTLSSSHSQILSYFALTFASLLFKSFRFYLISTIPECQTPIDNNKNRLAEKNMRERESVVMAINVNAHKRTLRENTYICIRT